MCVFFFLFLLLLTIIFTPSSLFFVLCLLIHHCLFICRSHNDRDRLATSYYLLWSIINIVLRRVFVPHFFLLVIFFLISSSPRTLLSRSLGRHSLSISFVCLKIVPTTSLASTSATTTGWKDMYISDLDCLTQVFNKFILE